MKTKLLLVVLVALLSVSPAAGDEPSSRKPSKADKCPVCGMFVYKYPDWTAQIIYRDGTTVYFDGAKDLFKYAFDPGKYAPQRTEADIAAIYVTEFYGLAPIDAHSAFFVVGSDVYGPMGRELIPFGSEADAAEFMKDHKGLRILRFDQVTAGEVEGLD